MKHAITSLKNSLFLLDSSYDDFVIKNNLNTDSPAAIINREKAKSFEDAIKILEASVEAQKVKTNEAKKKICTLVEFCEFQSLSGLCKSSVLCKRKAN